MIKGDSQSNDAKRTRRRRCSGKSQFFRKAMINFDGVEKKRATERNDKL